MNNIVKVNILWDMVNTVVGNAINVRIVAKPLMILPVVQWYEHMILKNRRQYLQFIAERTTLPKIAKAFNISVSTAFFLFSHSVLYYKILY